MPCHTSKPDISFENHLTLMLCQACKNLTKSQMMSISPPDGYIGLFQWYLEHLLRDYSKNYGTPEAEMAQREANRLEHELSKSDLGYQLKGYNE